MEGGDDLKTTIEASAMEGGGDLKSIEARATEVKKRTAEVTAGSKEEEGRTPPAAAGAGKRSKKKLMRAKEEFIELIMKHPRGPVAFIPEESLARLSEQFRVAYAESLAIHKEIMEFDAGIIEQYNTKGYAMIEEVVDEEEEEEAVQNQGRN